MPRTQHVLHPSWCSRDLCRTDVADVTHVELSALLVPAAEPSSYLTLTRTRMTDLDGTSAPDDVVELAVAGTAAPLSRDEARELGQLLIRYANTTG